MPPSWYTYYCRTCCVGRGVAELGPKWAAIAGRLTGRSDDAVRRRLQRLAKACSTPLPQRPLTLTLALTLSLAVTLALTLTKVLGGGGAPGAEVSVAPSQAPSGSTSAHEYRY